MPSDFALKTMNQIHRTMMKLSGGRLGWSVADMEVLELTTTGRKSGEKRSVMLTTPLRDGDSMTLVASAGGNDHHPAWFLNLRDDPQVTVRTRGETRDMTARVAEGDERAELWDRITSRFTNYADYQGKTDREIPVVVLDPAGSDGV